MQNFNKMWSQAIWPIPISCMKKSFCDTPLFDLAVRGLGSLS